MSDELDLLRAAEADPESDTPALVYADWLDDHDRSAEAAELRAYIAWSRVLVCDRCRGDGHDFDSGGERTVPWCPGCGGTGKSAPRPRATPARWAVLRDPGDDAARLAYADVIDRQECPACRGRCGERNPFCDYDSWLECFICKGRGRVVDEYAEFIRVQVEIGAVWDYSARCVCRAAEDVFHCPEHSQWEEHRGLRDRESYLWGHGFGGVGPVPGCSIALDVVGARNEPVLLIRRGFGAELRVPTLATLFGGTCGRCGYNPGRVLVNPGPDGRWEDCPACAGTGRTHGLAAAVWGRHPVTRVVVGDREPHDSSFAPQWNWFDDDGGRAADDRSSVPGPVFDLLAADPVPPSRPPRSHKSFPTRAAALDALSDAICARGRELAGLTPISQPETVTPDA